MSQYLVLQQSAICYHHHFKRLLSLTSTQVTVKEEEGWELLTRELPTRVSFTINTMCQVGNGFSLSHFYLPFFLYCTVRNVQSTRQAHRLLYSLTYTIWYIDWHFFPFSPSFFLSSLTHNPIVSSSRVTTKASMSSSQPQIGRSSLIRTRSLEEIASQVRTFSFLQ